MVHKWFLSLFLSMKIGTAALSHFCMEYNFLSREPFACITHTFPAVCNKAG